MERPRLFSQTTILLFLCTLLGFFCQTMNGFDGSLFGGLTANKTFLGYFHGTNDGMLDRIWEHNTYTKTMTFSFAISISITPTRTLPLPTKYLPIQCLYTHQSNPLTHCSYDSHAYFTYSTHITRPSTATLLLKGKTLLLIPFHPLSAQDPYPFTPALYPPLLLASFLRSSPFFLL